MEEPLTQFFIWWDGPDGKQQAVNEQESTYRIAQRAFSAGYAARFEAPLEPSRDVLEDRPVKMERPSPGHPGYGEPKQPEPADPFAAVRLPGRSRPPWTVCTPFRSTCTPPRRGTAGITPPRP